MKRLTNLIEPTNVIIVSDAYINGDRIVCRSGNDDFDLWAKDWMIDDISGVAVLPCCPESLNQSEQPVEGLEEEIENYYGRMPDDTDKIESARHFAEWGAKHLKK